MVERRIPNPVGVGSNPTVPVNVWGLSSSGRASALQAEGGGFKSHRFHSPCSSRQQHNKGVVMLHLFVLVLSIFGCEPVHYAPSQPTPVYYEHDPIYHPVSVPVYQPMPDRYIDSRRVVVRPTVVVKQKTTVVKTKVKVVQQPARKSYTFKSRRK